MATRTRQLIVMNDEQANPHENPGTLISFPTITSESSLSRRGPLLSTHFASGIEARGVERILENQGESKMFGISTYDVLCSYACPEPNLIQYS